MSIFTTVRTAQRGARLVMAGRRRRFLPMTDAALTAVALAAVHDATYAAAHKRLTEAPAGSDAAADRADAARAYADVARQVASRAEQVSRNPAACARVVEEARAEQRGLRPYYFLPWAIAIPVGIATFLISGDPRSAKITGGLVWLACVVVGAITARLRHAVFQDELAAIIDPEVNA